VLPYSSNPNRKPRSSIAFKILSSQHSLGNYHLRQEHLDGKKRLLLWFFQKKSKTTCWDGTCLAKLMPNCTSPSSIRRCVCMAAGIKLIVAGRIC